MKWQYVVCFKDFKTSKQVSKILKQNSKITAKDIAFIRE